MDSNKKKNSVRYKCQVRDINKKACLTRLQPDICFVTKVARGGRCSRGSLFYATFAPTLPPLCATAKAQMQVKRVLDLLSHRSKNNNVITISFIDFMI